MSSVGIRGFRIFGIGLNKTGTSTLGSCGEMLGYRVKGCDKELLQDVRLKNDFTRIREAVENHDLFEDWPWPLIYKELDKMYPGSKFILTVRKNEKKWIESLKKHSLKTPPDNHCRKLAYDYNYPFGHEKKHLQFYRKHNDEVREYFRGRESDFIELCWENGDGWDKLCPFLGMEVPETPFPHTNKTIDKKRTSRKLVLKNRALSIFFWLLNT